MLKVLIVAFCVAASTKSTAHAWENPRRPPPRHHTNQPSRNTSTTAHPGPVEFGPFLPDNVHIPDFPWECRRRNITKYYSSDDSKPRKCQGFGRYSQWCRTYERFGEENDSDLEEEFWCPQFYECWERDAEGHFVDSDTSADLIVEPTMIWCIKPSLQTLRMFRDVITEQLAEISREIAVRRAALAAMGSVYVAGDASGTAYEVSVHEQTGSQRRVLASRFYNGSTEGGTEHHYNMLFEIPQDPTRVGTRIEFKKPSKKMLMVNMAMTFMSIQHE